MEIIDTPAPIGPAIPSWFERRLPRLYRLWNTRKVFWESKGNWYWSEMEEERHAVWCLYWLRGLHFRRQCY